MSQQLSLKEAEKKVFRTRTNDGLWDILLGSYFLLFVVALYLSGNLGDFLSTMVILPSWGMIFLIIWLIRRFIVNPRIGSVKFGHVRKVKLTKFTGVMLIVNVIALVLGIIASQSFGRVPGQMSSIIFGILLLICFSIAAYYLDFNRLYIYGLLVGLAPLVGEWLWSQGYASHHGFPITFGLAGGIMVLAGLVFFVRFLRDNPVLKEEI